MRVIALLLVIPFLTGCPPPTWMVREEATIIGIPEIECVRNAILSVKGVKGVVTSDPGYAYSLTLKKLYYPRNYIFETDIGLGYIQIKEERGKRQFSAYFYGPGDKVPQPIQSKGKIQLEAIVGAVSKNCGISNNEQTHNK